MWCSIPQGHQRRPDPFYILEASSALWTPTLAPSHDLMDSLTVREETTDDLLANLLKA